MTLVLLFHLSLIFATTHCLWALNDLPLGPIWHPSSLVHASQSHLLSSPDFKVCHLTLSLTRNLRVVTPPLSSLSPGQSQTHVNPITCCLHFWSKSSNGAGWCHHRWMDGLYPWLDTSLTVFYTPLQKPPMFPSKGHTCHHSAQSLNQISSLFESYVPSFLPVVPAIHRSDPSSNPSGYSEMPL